MSPISLTSRRAVLAIVVSMVITLVASVLLLTQNTTDDAVAGIFVDASPLEEGAEVRAYGVKVGQVESIDLVDNQARVVLDINDEVLPLREDARMSIRPINLLGENFIELEPGSADRPELSGDLPVERTETVVTLQAVLNTFDNPTSAGLAALVSGLGNGVAGHGEDLAGVLKALAPTMQGIDELGDVLRSQNDVLDSLIATSDPVARAIAGDDGKRIDALVDQAHQMLQALTVERAGLEQTLVELPGAIKEARKTLAALDTVANSLAPTLKKARPVTQDLEVISDEIVEFSKYATPAFNSFDEVFAHADELIAQAAPAVRQLRSAGPELRRGSRSVEVAGKELLKEKPLGDLMAFVRKWALSTNSRDNISHYFRGLFHVTPKALNLLVGSTVVPEVLTPGEREGGNSDPDEVIPDVPGVDLGNLGDVLSPDNDILGGLLGNLLPGPASDKSDKKRKSAEPKSATGLTDKQEQNLLELLLGGGK